MAIHRLAADNGFFSDGGIRVTSAASPYATADGYGNPVASGGRVFGRRSLIWSAPVTTTLDSTLASTQPYSRGFWKDGVSECDVTQRITAQFRLNIRVGSETALTTGAYASNPTRTKDIFCAGGDALNPGWKTGREDVLRGSGASAGEDNLYRMAIGPGRSGGMLRVCYGLVAGAGAIYTGSGAAPAAGTCDRIGFVWWDEANQIFRCPSTHQGTSVQSGRARLETWAVTDPWISSDLLTQYWAIVDYRNNPGSSGGQLYVIGATRASIADNWTVGAMQLVAEVTGRTDEHWHSASVNVDAATGRMYITIIVGDTLNQRVMLITRADATTYTQGQATVDMSSDGVATANGWTCYTCAAGDPFSSPRKPSTQGVGLLRTTDQMALSYGSDETGESNAFLTVPKLVGGETASQARILTYGAFQTYGPTTANNGFNNLRNDGFPGGRMVSVPWTDASWGEDDSAVALMMANGSDPSIWGHFFSCMADNAKQSQVAVGKFCTLYGATNFPLVAINHPTPIVRRPYVITPAVTQYLRSNALEQAATATWVSTGNTCTINVTPSSIDSTIPPCPSNGPAVRLQGGSTTGRMCGQIRLSNAAVPKSASNVYIKVWVCSLNDQIPIINVLGFDWNGIGGGRRQPDPGTTLEPVTGCRRWFPRIINVGAPNAWNNNASITNPFSLSLQVRISDNITDYKACDTLMVFDSVIVGSVHIPITRPPGGDAAATNPTSFTATLPPIGSAWTFGAALQIPMDGWDEYWSGPASQYLFTLKESDSKYMTIAPSPSGNGIVVSYTGGVSASLTAVAGSSPFTQTINFARGAAMLLTLTHDGTTLKATVSVAGTVANETTVGLAEAFMPTLVVAGDKDGANVQPCWLHGFFLDSARAWTSTETANELNTLAVLSQNPGWMTNRTVRDVRVARAARS